ncbi:MAG: hypothetical protein KF860_15525 [Cyclobacteriaceae bacterium]|nr:hypothetical protein [Cyclobacteriaceae bacterium]
MNKFGLHLVLICLIFSGCDNDEAEFPELITSAAQQIGSTSVVLEAEIKETGSIRPIRYGFFWSTTPGLNIFNTANKLDLGQASEKKKFSIKLESLSPNTQYFVRSFSSDPDYSKIYYGNEISFTTLN